MFLFSFTCIKFSHELYSSISRRTITTRSAFGRYFIMGRRCFVKTSQVHQYEDVNFYTKLNIERRRGSEGWIYLHTIPVFRAILVSQLPFILISAALCSACTPWGLLPVSACVCACLPVTSDCRWLIRWGLRAGYSGYSSGSPHSGCLPLFC